ncbi:cob(I)yrinic acid a,c-diamide adenosyltransferase [Clostridium sp. JN-9]|uniref:cob(I)yrinic acid a,c-diamide adenosyltransferase n=1 Tax=Clostridium sp. JN-9 TaxID=2507159 RepID=UPI000FFE0CD1|nr:cob(I)yrinic acid a,c-diamide adenosyltransferase [Clostridium sp. JN-9]QAT39466.1 cob(I)yrinic acid a,c-diamide adenosyltransferase [Clostridium sp. JN-9]
MSNEKGYIQVYTGNGKGKTTAALGLSVRAVCSGKKVFFGQFVKGMKYSELEAVKFLPNFKMQQFGRNTFIFDKPTKADIDAANSGLKTIEQILISGEYDVVIMDEVNIAIFFELFSDEDVIKVLNKKADNVEVILTGRYATDRIIDRADLVTEMKEIKHYYTQGVQARKGIES